MAGPGVKPPLSQRHPPPRGFAPPPALLAVGPPNASGRAVAAPGGYRISGQWQFASGSRHATWLGAHCKVFESNGDLVAQYDARDLRKSVRAMAGAYKVATGRELGKVLPHLRRNVGGIAYCKEQIAWLQARGARWATRGRFRCPGYSFFSQQRSRVGPVATNGHAVANPRRALASRTPTDRRARR